jgi:hypothetical protein
MERLDVDPEVVNWWYEPFFIPYVANVRTKKVRKYYPDFLIEYKDGKKCVVEIKPSRKLYQARNVKKINAAVAFCAEKGLEFEVLTEFELKKIGVL